MVEREETTERRDCLALLVALICVLAWALVGLFMVLSFNSKVSIALAIPICLSVGLMLRSTSKLFLGREWPSALYRLVASSTVCVLFTLPLILLLPRDLARNLSMGMAMLLMSGLFIGAGSLLAVFPRFAEEALGELRAPALVKRLAGVFLIAVGCVCLTVP